MATEHAGVVLVVDDEAGVRELISRWLRGLGYEVVAAAEAEEALRSTAGKHVAVALCDIRMPGRDGLWLAGQLRQARPETAVVMATGVQDVGSAVSSLRHGAIDYLIKPFGRDRLREAVERGMAWHRAAEHAPQSGERRYLELRQRRDQIAQAIGALKADWHGALEAALALATFYDGATRAHVRRVADAALATARALARPIEELDLLECAALVHEMEKLALPDSILKKNGPLTPGEWDLVREAPVIGYDLLGGLPFLADAAGIVRARFERWDGGGYPRGLQGETIPLLSRILAVADTYDTMIRPRRAQSALSAHEALRELDQYRGTQFDPHVVVAFHRVTAAFPASPAR
jgi:putative two-component system response regulator